MKKIDAMLEDHERTISAEIEVRPARPARSVVARYMAGERSFVGENLTGEDLTDADLTGADFSGAILSDTQGVAVKLQRTILKDTDFSGAVGWERLDYHRVDLSLCHGIEAAQFAGASIRGVTLPD